MGPNGDDTNERSGSAGDPAAVDPAAAAARALTVGLALSVAAASRYAPLYLYALGGSPLVVGLYGSVGALVGVACARVRTRVPGPTVRWLLPTALASLGAFLWLVAPQLRLRLVGVPIPAWVWAFVGSTLVRAWDPRAFGRARASPTAVTNHRCSGGGLVANVAAAKSVERTTSLVGFLLAAVLFAAVDGFVPGFQVAAAVVAAIGSTVAVAGRILGVPARETARAAGSGERSTDDESRFPVAGDALVRFAAGMTSVFVVLFVATVLRPDATVAGHHLRPAAFFGVLLAVEAAVAALGLRPGAAVARRLGSEPLVAATLFVSAGFPVLLATAPPNARTVALAFAFSGLRFVGLSARETLLRDSARDERDRRGGRISPSVAYAVPSAALGGVAYAADPRFAFGLATAIGVLGALAFSRSIGGRRSRDSPRRR